MTTTANETEKTADRPVHEIRLGRVKGAIFLNRNDNGAWHNVVLKRLYRDSEGKWRSSDSFSRDDLLLVGKVSDLCHSWIYQAAQNGATANSVNSSTDNETF